MMVLYRVHFIHKVSKQRDVASDAWLLLPSLYLAFVFYFFYFFYFLFLFLFLFFKIPNPLSFSSPDKDSR